MVPDCAYGTTSIGAVPALETICIYLQARDEGNGDALEAGYLVGPRWSDCLIGKPSGVSLGWRRWVFFLKMERVCGDSNRVSAELADSHLIVCIIY